MENSALSEENEYLKRRIKNAERNASINLNRSSDKLDISSENPQISQSVLSIKIPKSNSSFLQSPLTSDRYIENADTVPTYRKENLNPIRISYPSSLSRSVSGKNLQVHEFALLRSALLYNL
ncbi:hypothetical protein SteCoe_2363 [Stentor coeruleus]|uniref:Uncharacterized protein n=1 Tax=Stentor coeruleus TaxID=5963 RepID=A0A1R2CZM6_9CILI|nr:hypothetical protein SteCoe_2363 [Stentor coeruleus]